jgi:DNA-binding response OmpR family regulator
VSTVPAQQPILIVDDDEPTQRLLQAVMHRSGFRSEVAANGREAIALLQTRSYGAVVLDMMMPAVGGRDVIEYMLGHAIDVPVIVCSAAGPAALTGFPPLVKAVLRKPFDVDQLVTAVREASGRATFPSRVLIIEDDPRARFLLRSLLEPATVIEAEDGNDGLDLIRRSRADVVFLDLILPGRPGEELLLDIAASEDLRHIPVIVVTARLFGDADRQRLLDHAAAVMFKGELSRASVRAALDEARRWRR